MHRGSPDACFSRHHRGRRRSAPPARWTCDNQTSTGRHARADKHDGEMSVAARAIATGDGCLSAAMRRGRWGTDRPLRSRSWSPDVWVMLVGTSTAVVWGSTNWSWSRSTRPRWLPARPTRSWTSSLGCLGLSLQVTWCCGGEHASSVTRLSCSRHVAALPCRLLVRRRYCSGQRDGRHRGWRWPPGPPAAAAAKRGPVHRGVRRAAR